MGWLDGDGYGIKERPLDAYTITKDGITARKSFIVSGPSLSPQTPEIQSTLLDVSREDDIPKIGDSYDEGQTSPVCVSVDVQEIENGENTEYKMYLVQCEYELQLGTETLPMIEWAANNYGVATTAERYYFEPQQETVHIDSSKVFERYGDGEDSPLIGLDENGGIAGVDIQDFSSVLVVERFYKLADLNFENIQNALGKTNSAAFYGRAIGECLFVSAQEIGRTMPIDLGGPEKDNVVKMAYRFLISRNLGQEDLPTFTKQDESTFQITNGKKGWEYLWVKNVTKAKNTLVTTYTEKAQVHEVYESTDLAADLGIGGGAVTWKKGDLLSAQNLNRKTLELSKQFVGGGDATLARNSSPDLIFRQENSSMPSNGEEFPPFFARKAFRILGVMGFKENGTYTVTLKSDTQHNPDTELIEYSNTDENDGVKFLESDKDGYVGEGDKVILRVDAQSSLEGFQFNVILRLLS